MKKLQFIILFFSFFTYCWSDPYIIMTEGASGTGPLRKEAIEESLNNETEINLEAEVFPNPAENSITIKIPVSNGLLEVMDVVGKKVGKYTLTQHSTTLDISQYPNGLYNLIISTATKNYHIKLVISK